MKRIEIKTVRTFVTYIDAETNADQYIFFKQFVGTSSEDWDWTTTDDIEDLLHAHEHYVLDDEVTTITEQPR